jgi:sarcosine oxidase, subunit beta
LQVNKQEFKASVVIVGGGVTGLSTAWWLARSGVDVLVLDKGIVGWEASGRNGGGTTHFHSSLFHEEQRLWPKMDEMLGYPTEYRRERLIIAMTEQEVGFYAAWRIQGRRLGFEVSDLDTKQVLELVPFASPNNLGGMRLHFGGHANPQRTSQAYAWALQDLGGRILQHAPVLRIVKTGSRVTAVETPRGRISFDTLVVAAGPQTASLLQPLGHFLPLAAARAEMIVTEPVPLIPVGGVDGNGLYGRQTLRGNLAFGGGPHEWLAPGYKPNERPSSPLIRNLALRLADLMPGVAQSRLIRSWAGIIENTPDGRPVLDRLTDPDNLVVASMSSVGFGLSPAVGHAVRDLVLEGHCTFADIEKYKLSRFLGFPPDWAAQRGWVSPGTGG